MTSKRQLLRQQRAWAETRRLPVDDRGYLETINANLRTPLSHAARAAFEDGGGSELRGRGTGPAKMRALHSSAALVVNVFDHWSPESAAPLLRALSIDDALASPPRFEAQFATGLPGTPPNLDLALMLASGRVIGMESKFTEWMTPKRASRPAFKQKYFDGGIERWTQSGLPRCQALAWDLMKGALSYRHLDAAQLLKHALGLATQQRNRFALYYLYYDVPSSAGAAHAEEVARFGARVGDELAFKAVTYQDLYQRLAAAPLVDADYLDYLGSRYFPAVTEPAA